MLFARLKEGLSKTRSRIAAGLRSILAIGRKVDAELLEELEALLLGADLGIGATTAILEDLRTRYKEREIREADEIIEQLKEDLKGQLLARPSALNAAPTPPTVVMVVGVNGTGKTTSIGKLSHYLKTQGKGVLLSASDTFRAGAVEQLEIWSQRVGIEMVRHASGADPAAVAFDACDAALARKADYLIVDTAGRLHTNKNLMQELSKIERVVGKKVAGAPHEVLLVLDATTGQNALVQARTFKEFVNVTGLFLAKLDGTAKGGIVIPISRESGIPVKFIGVGEKLDDIEPFEAERFVEALFSAG
ncbi:MAG: signal recognition particle-docking protein FtsY [Planctomycetota bacterium]